MVVVLTLLFSSAFSTYAQSTKPVDGQTMNITYGSTSWNTDSRKIDSAYLVMKDKTTGKMVQIQLEETEPDSSKFDGKFSVSLSDTDPQVFIPPKELRNPERDYKKVFQMIQSGQLTTKPIVWKKNEKGQALVDVYDTKEQADAVQNAYQTEQKLKAAAEHNRLVKVAQAKEQALAAKAAEAKALMEKLALEAARRESDRVRMEQIERQKAAERERAAKAMTEKQKAERKAQAQSLADEAMVFFRQGEFDSAEQKFRQAVELDPENRSYYFRYGVTLFRTEKFNESLVILKLAQVEPNLELERSYFMGLVHYRLKEYKPAKEHFAKASASNDDLIGPSSTFYLGILQYSLEEYEPAKKSFEKVLDTSKDPKMDAQAEEYIERILNALKFKKLQEKRWTANGTLGLTYDSNVILSPDTSSTEATDQADARLITLGDLSYRAIYNQTHQLSVKGSANLMNSSKSAVSRADPFMFDLSTPYNYTSTAFKKGYVLSLKPTYQILYMDPTSSGKKTNIMSSYFVGADNLFVMKPDWFAVYGLEVRSDDFKLSDSVGDNDYDAMKITLKTTQMVFMDKAHKEALIANFGVGLNAAKGKNKKYNRIEAGVNYMRPMKWGYSWNAGLAVYNLDYSSSTDGRKDLNVTFTTGVDKPIKDWVSWGVSAAYTKNDSTNETSYEYSKWMIMSTATFTTIF